MTEHKLRVNCIQQFCTSRFLSHSSELCLQSAQIWRGNGKAVVHGLLRLSRQRHIEPRRTDRHEIPPRQRRYPEIPEFYTPRHEQMAIRIDPSDIRRVSAIRFPGGSLVKPYPQVANVRINQ